MLKISLYLCKWLEVNADILKTLKALYPKISWIFGSKFEDPETLVLIFKEFISNFYKKARIYWFLPILGFKHMQNTNFKFFQGKNKPLNFNLWKLQNFWCKYWRAPIWKMAYLLDCFFPKNMNKPLRGCINFNF